MKGKEKCELLKSIRREIAQKNGIKLEVPECTHRGDCLGSCPRCEAEVKYLEKQLELRRNRGIKPIVAGISAGLITVTASSCVFPVEDQLQGDMLAPESTDTTASEDTALYITEGSLTMHETDEQTVGEIEKMPIGTDTEEYVLDGDIAFLPDDELELEGVMPYLPSDELTLAGDIALPIESSEELPFEPGEVITAADEDMPETTDIYTEAEEPAYIEATTEYAADTIED